MGYPPEVWPTVKAAVEEAIVHGKSYDLEVPFITAKNRTIWVRVQGFPTLENGKVTGLKGTFQDISDRKANEEKAEVAKTLLEQERLKSVHTAKLASIGEMAAGIAHEINNPLAIIQGTVRTLPKFVNDPKKLAEKIRNVQSASERITKIVKSLQKFSRTSDRSEYQVHSLCEIVNEAINLASSKARRHSTSVEVECKTECRIFCDEIEIEQV